MGIDVIDLVGREFCIPQGKFHGPAGATALFVGGGDVERIGTHAVADQFAINLCAAFFGVFVFFQDDDSGPFAHEEPIAILIEWATRAKGIIIASRESAHVREPGQTDRRNRRLRAARDHHVGLTTAHDFGSFTHGMSARRAG